jgi:hypothetical protein
MELTHKDLKGVITATVTAFTAEGKLDEAEVRRHAEDLIARGTSGLAPLGGTGEYPSTPLRAGSPWWRGFWRRDMRMRCRPGLPQKLPARRR